MKIKRYYICRKSGDLSKPFDNFDELAPREDGEVCKYEDVEKLEKENERLEAQNVKLTAGLKIASATILAVMDGDALEVTIKKEVKSKMRKSYYALKRQVNKEH